jgi:hypothetical protein
MTAILKPLWVVSIFWRGNDPLFSVAGYSRETVEKKADELWDEEFNTVLEQESDAPENSDIDLASLKSDLEADLCSSGINSFYGKKIDSLGIPAENWQELEQNGITVY